MSNFSKDGGVACLGIFPSSTEKFVNDSKPPTGFREVILLKESELFKNIPHDKRYYFDHSYYIPVNDQTSCAAGNSPIYSAVVEKDLFYGAQFRPEKSGEAGKTLLKNFANSTD
jgi:glutamine amidotransferase